MGEARPAGAGPTDADDEGVSLVSFRARVADTTARWALIASVIIVGGRIAEYVGSGELHFLVSVGIWIICDVFFWRARARLRRGDVDGAAARILVATLFVVSVNSLFEVPALSLTGFLLGFPVLQICALAMAPPEQLRVWSRGLPILFCVAVLLRQLVNPMAILESPLDLLTVAIGGAFGLVIIGSLSVGLQDTLRRALGASEEARGALGHANLEIAAARDQALAASTAKSAFLATMSHELRTPLNAIIGYSELLLEEHDDPSIRGDVKRIHGAGAHLLVLINDILDLSKVEAGKTEINVEAIAIAALLDGIADTLGPTIERGGNRLELEVSGDVGLIESDLTKVRQILINLIGNAAKFTHDGEIRVIARSIEAAGAPGVEVSVEDTGIGIPADKLATIFDPFVQADASTTRRYGGTGLGLAITRRFCEMLGGTLTVVSEVGKGSRFTVWLPRQIAPELRSRGRTLSG
ncbi:MAG: hypothetical protein KC420_05970 [Myxococcales bacterium]|nr:hypothetical protein [Myxococcales bacterium]